MRAFVTGGSGFVGRALVRRLVGGGHDVVALARSAAAEGELASLGARAVRGDVLSRETLVAGMAGCDVAFNVAGVNAMCLRDPGPMMRVNVEGARNVVAAAAEAGVGRVVHTSSGAAIGEPEGVVATEDTPHRGYFLSRYERSKHEAERAALEESAARGVEVVCVNPSSVQGPGRTGGSARLLIDYANGKLRAIVDTRISIVDVSDCAEAHVLAAERGVSGERYLVSAATLTTREAIDLVARVAGVRHKVATVPRATARAGAAAGAVLATLRRRDPRVCPELVRVLLHGHAYDGSKATRELGLAYTPIEETIRRTLDWYRERGIVS